VYLPIEWLEERGCRVEDLDGSEAGVGMRAVLDRCLSGVEDLLDAASALPHRLDSRRLAMEASVTLRLAQRLMTSLRRRDPLAERVRLSKSDFLFCGLSGIKHALFGAPTAEQRPSNIGLSG
jgi:farnesyl-diphosphate farnesyltransferase